jgi:hypothetical protein
LGEHHLDVRHRHADVLGHNFRRDGTEPLITLAVVLVPHKGEAAL